MYARCFQQPSHVMMCDPTGQTAETGGSAHHHRYYYYYHHLALLPYGISIIIILLYFLVWPGCFTVLLMEPPFFYTRGRAIRRRQLFWCIPSYGL